MSQAKEELSHRGKGKSTDSLSNQKRKREVIARGKGAEKDKKQKDKAARKVLKKSLDTTICVLQNVLKDHHLVAGTNLFHRLRPYLLDICKKKTGNTLGMLIKCVILLLHSLNDSWILS
jgi:hypothetical protein